MNNELKPWYAVALPHKDIREGRLDEAVFAANIWAVVQGTAPDVYLDPEEFYKKTFMTAGIAAILKRVSNALRGNGEAGDRIISLQTAFGGGKTHTLVALWHLAKYAKRLLKSPDAENLRKVLGDKFPEKVKNVAVFTNATCDATQGRKTTEGIHTRTLWGELALQLGGKTLYEKVRINDETQRVPQGLFVEVLQKVSPCLILLDELADYCVGAAAVSVGNTTLADQTISFIQQLTEAVHQVPGAVVIATLPASKYEVAQSEAGQEAFITLEKRFQRLGSDVKPVADDEIYDVVRTRLFENITPPEDPEYPERLAKVYQGMYASHSGEVPTEASKNTYREQLIRAYPFHPLLIDTFYLRWGSHPDFQRTRGVLRLLASIVGDLWQSKKGNAQTQHFIQPCHIRWSIDALQAALTRLWGPAYQAVAAADTLGEKSNAGIFDDERGDDYRREAIGQGLASAILLGSFGGQGGRSGFSSKDLKLACSKYGLNWNYTDGALIELENRCFFLHTTTAGSLGKRYWFTTKPTLNKLIIQYRQLNANATFDEEILDDIRKESQKSVSGGSTWRVIVNPGEELPEQKNLALLILPPSLSWQDNGGSKEAVQKYVMEISAKCGGKDRIYRNTLLFLSGTSRGLNKLRQAYREWRALESIRADYCDQLDDEQKEELKKRLESAKISASESLGPAYTVSLRVHGAEVEACVHSDARHSFQEHISYIWKTLIEDEEWILRRVGTVSLEKTGLIPKEGGIRLKDAIDTFLRFTDKPMITSKDAVVNGFTQACADGVIGIGRGGSPTTLQARYCKQIIPVDPNEDGVWIIPPFVPELTKQQIDTRTSTITTKAGTIDTTETGIPDIETKVDTGESQSKPSICRFVISGNVPMENWHELFRCFVGPAARMNLKKLKLGIQFEMEVSDEHKLSPNNSVLKAMKEAAKQLGLIFEIEE